MIRKYLVRLTFIRGMIREAARISASRGSTIMKKHVESEERGAKERVRNARLHKITTLQGTDIDVKMPDWAHRLQETVFESLEEMKDRQSELKQQQEKLEEQ